MIRRMLLTLVLLFGCLMPYGLITSSLSAQTYGTHYSPSSPRGTTSQRGIVLAPDNLQSFRSTSVMPLSGSALPMAAATGTTVAIWSTGPLRDGEDPFGGQTIGGTTDPNEPGTPVGDIPWLVMAVLMIGYIVRLKIRKTRLEEELEESE